MPLPYVSADLPGVAGQIKLRNEDFVVHEIPLYEPSGQGEHVYAEIQKSGLTTFAAIDHLAAALDVNPRAIGYAGMKDARAITRQTISIPGVTEEAVLAAASEEVQVLSVNRHVNKIRLGHLAGNRFTIRIREVEPTHVIRAKAIIDRLAATGMPNYFGEQRFGRRGNNDRLGAALLRGDDKATLHHLLGDAKVGADNPQQHHARDLFDQGDLARSMKAWPRASGLERRILHRLIKTGKPSAAVRTLDDKLRRLFVSALQSRLFNDILSARIAAGTFATLQDGDWAYKHDNGACFHVESAAAEQPRLASFEISPTGPLVGYRVSMATGTPGELEQTALTADGLTPEMFRIAGRHKVKGARRPLRVRPTDCEVSGGVDSDGSFITLAFTLPPGSFATVLLTEVMKSPEAAENDATTTEGSHPLGATDTESE